MPSRIVWLLWLPMLGAAPLHAAPLDYVIHPTSSSLSFDLVVDVTISIDAGSVGGTLSQSSTLSSTLTGSPSGEIVADWGAPDWADSLRFDGLSAFESVGSSLSESFDFTFGSTVPPYAAQILLEIDSSAVLLDLGSVLTTQLSPSEATPGPGPWSFADVADVSAQAALGIDLSSSFAAALSDSLAILPTPVSDVPLSGELRRSGPTGNELALGVGPLSLSGSGSFSSSAPGCEVFSILLGCLLNIVAVDVTIDSAELRNLELQLVATNATAIPEPSTALLVACAGPFGAAVLRRSIPRRAR